MKSMNNGATLIKKWTAELLILLWYEDHPALVGVDAAKAEVIADALLLLEPVEPVVVPVGSEAVVMSVLNGVPCVKPSVVTKPEIERDVVAGVDESGVEPEDAGDDELVEPGEEISVMAKAGLVSPESPIKTIR